MISLDESNFPVLKSFIGVYRGLQISLPDSVRRIYQLGLILSVTLILVICETSE